MAAQGPPGHQCLDPICESSHQDGKFSPTRPPRREPRLSFAQHTITVNRDTGERVAMDTVQSLGRHRSMSVTSANEHATTRGRSKTITSDPRSIALTFLEHVEIFHKSHYEWHPADYMEANYMAVIELCNQAADCFRKEPRLVQVDMPAYIMGDLHGNFQDLMAFGHAFWRQGANVCPANLVFLGDYVDRRYFSVEVIIYLFAQKLTAPHKVILLRGNHELRDTNQVFGFLDECLRKFGAEHGQQVWEAANNAFDCLPLAAVVGGAAFCCHGGIPGPECSGDMSEILRVPCPLRSDDENIVARDVLWSDPMEADTVEEFEPNAERGVSYKFSTRALEKFLQRNDLEFVIRAHQYKVHLGFQIQKKNKLVTVFSSSAYCGQSNEASIVLVADGKLRVMRLDTLADRMDSQPVER